MDLTPDVEVFAAEMNTDGLLHVFVPHATAGVALIEVGAGTEPDLGRRSSGCYPARICTSTGMGR